MLNRIISVVFMTLFVVACAQEAPAPAADAANEAAAAGESAAAAVAEAGDAAADAVAAATEMPVGDAERGKRFYIFCQACHTINAGGMNKVGPNLHGVIDRAAGAAEGFVYSEALANSGITWDAAALDEWIARPAEMVPGTTMVFAGINDPQQRADLIAFMAKVAAE